MGRKTLPMSDANKNAGLRLGGVVLCGGGSVRMGRDKALLPFGNEPMLNRVVRRVSGVIQPVVVAAQQHQTLPPLDVNVRVVFDAVPDSGPLAGILAAMNELAGECDAIFVCACDQPLIRPAFIVRLIELLVEHNAVVPVTGSRIHPVTAIYSLSTKPILADMVANRELKAMDFVVRCGACRVGGTEFVDVDPDLESLRNINDDETYRSILERTEPGS